MKKIVVVFISIILFNCNKKPETSQEVLNKEVVEDAIEPTTPEETEFYEPLPPTVNPTAQNGVPSDAIVLFDGSNLDAWEHSKDGRAVEWLLNADGSMTVKDKSGDIRTKQKFGSVQLHVEWKSPKETQAKGQNRANSGVFLQERYEVQVLDNNDNDTYVNGQVGSVYKQSVPLAKASVPSGKWNTYDIIYHAPEFNDKGEKTKSATVTVLHNGVLIQNHFELEGPTAYIGKSSYFPHPEKMPLRLQDHGDLVSFRNIKIRPLSVKEE